MIVDQLVIHTDHIEVLRKKGPKQRRPLKCPYAYLNNGNCHPDCVCCGDPERVARHIPNESYVDHSGVILHLSCGNSMDIICEYAHDFADLRSLDKQEAT